MKNKNKLYISVVLFCVLVLAIAAVVFLPLKTASEMPEEETVQDIQVESSDTAVVVQEREVETIEKSIASTCVVKIEADAEDRDQKYQEGTILVSFSEGLTYEDAGRVLSIYDLKVKQEEGVESSIPLGNWVTVIVPKGEEFEWICTLRDHNEVRHAGLNLLFELRQ